MCLDVTASKSESAHIATVVESEPTSSDGHRLGHVDGLVVDADEQVTHLLLERGHLWGRREVTIPIGAVAKVETDKVTLRLSKDEVGALKAVPIRRWSS